MTLWWIGDVLLLVVVLPVVVYLLKGVLDAARGIVPGVDRVAAAARAGRTTSRGGGLAARSRSRAASAAVA